MAVQVPAEMLRRGVLHALVQPHHLRLLRHHVDDEVGRQAVGAVGEPLDEIAVGKAGDPHRAALVVDLGVVGQDLKLGHHVRQLAQLPAAQPGGGVAVQHGDLVVADLLHLRGKIAGGQGQELAVGPGPQHHPGGNGANRNGGDQRDHHKKRDGTLLFHKAEVPSGPRPLKAGGQHRADTVHGAQQKHKEVEVLRMGIQRRKLHIEVHQPHQHRDGKVDERPGKGRPDGFARFALFLRALGKVRLRPLTAGLITAGVEAAEIAEVEGKWHCRIPFRS